MQVIHPSRFVQTDEEWSVTSGFWTRFESSVARDPTTRLHVTQNFPQLPIFKFRLSRLPTERRRRQKDTTTNESTPAADPLPS